jgi:hypothetical protein
VNVVDCGWIDADICDAVVSTSETRLSGYIALIAAALDFLTIKKIRDGYWREARGKHFAIFWRRLPVCSENSSCS